MIRDCDLEKERFFIVLLVLCCLCRVSESPITLIIGITRIYLWIIERFEVEMSFFGALFISRLNH